MGKAVGSRTGIVTPDDFKQIECVFREMVQGFRKGTSPLIAMKPLRSRRT